jgi:propanol-preferring alcohol dehydrogenase
MAIQFAKLSGARVIGVSRSNNHLTLAKQVGADVAVSSQDRDFASIVGLVDFSIVFAPSDDYTSMAVKSTKKGGTIIIGVRGNIHDFPFNREITVKGTGIGTRIDMQNVLRIASQGLVHAKINVYNLSNANTVLLNLKKAEIQG